MKKSVYLCHECDLYRQKNLHKNVDEWKKAHKRFVERDRKKIIFTFRKVALLTESRRIMSLLREVEILLLFMDVTESESRSLSSLNTLLLLLLPTIFK